MPRASAAGTPELGEQEDQERHGEERDDEDDEADGALNGRLGDGATKRVDRRPAARGRLASATRTATVVVLSPPAVEPGAPPIRHEIMDRRSDALVSSS